MTAINADINASVGWIPLADPEALDPGYYTIGSESITVEGLHLQVTSLPQTPANGRWVTRGVGGSTAATHSSGATLTRYYPDSASAGGGATPTLAEVLAEGADASDTTIISDAGMQGPSTADRAGGSIITDGGAIDGTSQLSGGNASTPGHAGGNAELYGGASADAGSGASLVVAGATSDGSGNGNGGDVTLTSGTGAGTGRNGLVFLNLPTADPGVLGALWADTLVVKVSAG